MLSLNVQIDYALIGERIRAYRRAAHLTQAELAERSGICMQFVGCLERGQGIPSLATVLSLCVALDVEPNALLQDAARYNPDAACSLHDVPSSFQNTLTALWFQKPEPIRITPTDSDCFPPLDITLQDHPFLPDPL